jgi:hypothetical protein
MVAAMTSTRSVNKIGIAAAAVVALGAFGFWLFQSRDSTSPASPAAVATGGTTEQAPSGTGRGPSSPPTAMAICRKMESAGIVGVCEASANESRAPFDGVAFNFPQNSSAGMVVQAHDAATYGVLEQRITTGYILRYEGPRVIVQMDQETPPEVRAKVKPLLDDLLAH